MQRGVTPETIAPEYASLNRDIADAQTLPPVAGIGADVTS